MEKISGIGLFKFQKNKAKEEAAKKLQANQIATTSELIKSNREKDALIKSLFITVNELSKEVAELKGE